MRRFWVRFVICLAFGFGEGVIVGCNDGPARASDLPGTFVILVDRSGSISSAYSRRYQDYMRESIFPSLTPSSHVVVEPIVGEETSTPDPSHYVDVYLPSVDPFHKDFLYYIFSGSTREDKKCDASRGAQLQTYVTVRNGVESTATQLVHGGDLAKHTFILDGIRESSRYFQQGLGRKVLVVFSDGVEESNEFGTGTNFNNPGFWRGRNPRTMVSQLDPAHEFSGLRGARVYFIGMNAKQSKPVNAFWDLFFKAAGVGSESLIRFPKYTEPTYLTNDPTAIRERLRALCK